MEQAGPTINYYAAPPQETIPSSTSLFQSSTITQEAGTRPQTLTVAVQEPPTSSGLGALASYIIGWVIWAYAWCILSAVSIFFIRSHYDIVATAEHALIIAVYPLIELVMTLYRECLLPFYCLLDACFFDLIDHITFWSKSNYSVPDKCGGKNSVYCENNPHPMWMTESWFLCGHGHSPVGGQCTSSCNSSTQPGISLKTD